MSKIYFLFGVHNHQPVGNFPEIFEKAYEKAYLSFLKILAEHPQIKFNYHCSGIIWEWIKEYHPEFLDQIKKMLNAGQIELLTGAYYEPVLPAIPDSDKLGQIHKLTDFIQQEFNVTPTGCWLTERVWEPHLAKVLAEAGIKYTILDDAHFLSAGLAPEQLTGYFITEEQGKMVKIFPISQRLRYLIPFGVPEEIIEYLRPFAQGDNSLALTIVDDGEKFGIWPETYRHVYEDGWLDKFLTLVEANCDWLIPLTFTEYLDHFPPRGRVYLPTGAYFEMSEWAIPNAKVGEEFADALKGIDNFPQGVDALSKEKIRRFLKGGFWRNFLVKYPEANNAHKKMLYVSDKVNKAKSEMLNLKSRKTKKEVAEYISHINQAVDALYAGQCNCAYWHGVFGGVYLPHLRQAVYHNLIQAEAIIDNLVKKDKDKLSYQEIDFHRGGGEEILIETSMYNLYFDLSEGGTLFEWDFIPGRVNLVNVLTRRPEAYHRRLKEYLKNHGQESDRVKTIHELVRVKEEGLENYLYYDWYNRACFIDHFFHPLTTWEDFRKCQYGEQGDFVNQPYWANINKLKNKLRLSLRRKGQVWDEDEKIPFVVEKEINVDTSSLLKVHYRLLNQSAHAVSLWFGCEFNFAFSKKSEEGGELVNQNIWEKTDQDQKIKVTVRFNHPTNIWHYPLETVSSSEAGFERTYQGTIFLPYWKFTIKPKKVWSTEFALEIKSI